MKRITMNIRGFGVQGGHRVYSVVSATTERACVHRALSVQEEEEAVRWACKQSDGVRVSAAWHPVVQNELLESGKGVE
jgi:hypothetical protein